MISTIREESKDIPPDHYPKVLDDYQLKSFSVKQLSELPFSRLVPLLSKIRSLINDYIPKYCPWCGTKTQVYLSGSYIGGWTSFVHCSDHLTCGVRGPEKNHQKEC
jgi:hypothetical protein